MIFKRPECCSSHWGCYFTTKIFHGKTIRIFACHSCHSIRSMTMEDLCYEYSSTNERIFLRMNTSN